MVKHAIEGPAAETRQLEHDRQPTLRAIGKKDNQHESCSKLHPIAEGGRGLIAARLGTC